VYNESISIVCSPLEYLQQVTSVETSMFKNVVTLHIKYGTNASQKMRLLLDSAERNAN
jgi:hypothetical protein